MNIFCKDGGQSTLEELTGRLISKTLKIISSKKEFPRWLGGVSQLLKGEAVSLDIGEAEAMKGGGNL